MPKRVTRSDKLLLHYLCKKLEEDEKDSVRLDEIVDDFENFQNEIKPHFYNIYGENGTKRSPDIQRDLSRLKEIKKVDVEEAEGEERIRPSGMGYLSGRSLELPTEFDEALNKTL